MIKLYNKLKTLLNVKQKRFLFILVVMMIFFSLLEMFSIGMLVFIFSKILNTGNAVNIFVFNEMVALLNSFDQSKMLQILFVAFFLLFLIKFVYLFCLLYYKNKLIYQIRNDFSKRIFFSYLNKTINYHLINNLSKICYINKNFMKNGFTHARR
jgi:ABC-type multidrug transport system fused ATPase/permease subunit